jgi:hypothetical protein
MATENDFLPFAVGGSANVTPQAVYAADTTLTQGGFQSGLAKSPDLNKVWRQSSIMSAVLAQFIVDQSGQNAVDDGTTATLEANLLLAITNIASSKAGGYAGFLNVGAATTLTSARANFMIRLGATTGYTVTLPLGSTMPAQSTITFYNQSTVSQAIATQGSDVIAETGVNVQPVTMHVGDWAVFAYNATTTHWEIISGSAAMQFNPVTVSPATQSQHAVQLGQVGHGQCKIKITSATALSVVPYGGDNVIVNGVPLQIPSAGLSITNSGLVAGTIYYLYLSGTTAAPVLAFSTTGHSTAPNGVETMTGDVTKTLVGAVVPNTSAQFQNSGAYFGVGNWFNRMSLTANYSFPANVNFSNVGIAEITSAARVSIWTWAGETGQASIVGAYQQVSALNGINVVCYINGSAAGNTTNCSPTTANAPIPFCTLTQAGASPVGDGMATSMAYGNVGASTGTILLSSQNLISARI